MSPNQPSAFNPFGERHTIETPEQTPLQFAVAGIGSRFLALALDTIYQMLALFAVLIATWLVGLTGMLSALPDMGTWGGALVIGFFFVLHHGYFAGFEILWSGQTPGKRQVGLRVVKDSGRPLTVSEAIARNLLRIADEFPGVYAVGIVTAMLNSRNKRLGDFVAGSLVIREGSLVELRPTWMAQPQATQTALPLAGAALSSEDLTLIETFLLRRSELPADVRARMAEGILQRIQSKFPVELEPGSTAESLLERLAYERRSMGGYA